MWRRRRQRRCWPKLMPSADPQPTVCSCNYTWLPELHVQLGRSRSRPSRSVPPPLPHIYVRRCPRLKRHCTSVLALSPVR